MLTYADLFTGIGGATIGARNAGLSPIWGIEKSEAIAHLGNINVGNVLCADVRSAKWNALEPPDWLHVSPPCVNASIQKMTNRRETMEDIELGIAIQTAITQLSPKYFSLENVSGYKDFIAFRGILDRLTSLGYNILVNGVLDASKAGVPQIRKRLVLVATTLDAMLSRPLASSPVGWHESIKDLIPELPMTTLTNWQKTTLRNAYDLREGLPDMVIKRSGSHKKNGVPSCTIRLSHEPMFTVKAMSGNQRPSVKQATILVDGIPYDGNSACLLRWQTLPDNTQLSGNLVLDTKVIGNAMPPKLMECIIKSVLK